ncbi:MAG TPA: hypothetical protein VF597_00820 [Candidatus Saccharimonadales bacterium]|jgi:hypothetical protein
MMTNGNDEPEQPIMKRPYMDQLYRYLQLPKDFVGPERADDLYFMYEQLKSAKHSWTYQFVAGSVAAESGLMGRYLSADERHDRLEAANRSWKDAQEGFIVSHMNNEWSDGRLYAVPDRIEMHRSFLPLYHEMVDGYVTQQTSEQTHDRLVSLAVSNLDLHDTAQANDDFGAISARRGLAYELGTLLTITRLQCPSLFAVPVPARADHGAFFPEQTHDVRLVQQSWGEVNWCVPYEVKPASGGYKDRYDSAFVRGRVELRMPSSSDPLDIVRYMKEEVDGTISEQHTGELNEITSRILRLAEDYKCRQKIATMALAAS